MSIDIRVQYADPRTSSAIVTLGLFIAPLVAACAGAFSKHRQVRLISAGYLLFLTLFIVELAAIRFQEPFVLYRSYLWAPGIFVSLAAIFFQFPTRMMVCLAVSATIACMMISDNRLSSMSTQSTVWNDAAEKLASDSMPGAARIYYNRGLTFLKKNEFSVAEEDFSRAIRAEPKVGQLYVQRGISRFGAKQYAAAIEDFDQAVSLMPGSASAHYLLGLARETSGALPAAKAAYEKSLSLGFLPARLRLERFEQSAKQK